MTRVTDVEPRELIGKSAEELFPALRKRAADA